MFLITLLFFPILCIFHKMSESFTDCQEFIQLQDQQFYRLKLQHALDLKVGLCFFIRRNEGKFFHHIWQHVCEKIPIIDYRAQCQAVGLQRQTPFSISSFITHLILQELQGQTLHTTLSGPPPYLGPPSRLTDPPSSQCASNTQATVQSGTPYDLL